MLIGTGFSQHRVQLELVPKSVPILIRIPLRWVPDQASIGSRSLSIASFNLDRIQLELVPDPPQFVPEPTSVGSGSASLVPTTCSRLIEAIENHHQVESIKIMVLVLDGSSEYDVHLWSARGNVISLRHWFTSIAASCLQKIFLHTFATCSELPYYIRIMFKAGLNDILRFFCNL